MSSATMKFKRNQLESLLLELADEYNIRIIWDDQTAAMVGLCALAGAFLGGWAKGRKGALVGAGVGGVTGFAASQCVPLRQLWVTVKEKLQELLYILDNYLKTLSPQDFAKAAMMLMTCATRKEFLVINIIEHIEKKLDRHVLSNLNA